MNLLRSGFVGDRSLENLLKRMPLATAMLVAASLLALSGCVTASKGLNSAGTATQSDTPETKTADAAASPSKSTAYRDPLITKVSNGSTPQANAETAPVSGSSALPGSATAAPANIGGLALQPTAINAHASSIY